MVHVKTRSRVSNSCGIECLSQRPMRAVTLALPLVFLVYTWLQSEPLINYSSDMELNALLQLGSTPTKFDAPNVELDTDNDATASSLDTNERMESGEKIDSSEPTQDSGLKNHGPSTLDVRNDETERKALAQPAALETLPQTIVSLEDERAASLKYVKSFQTIGRPLKFFHIPKTAGTAIESAAGKQRISWGSCLFNHKPKRSICRYPDGPEWPQYMGWWHLPAQLFPMGKNDPYQGAELFGVIRDPYDRMVSEFYYICTLKVFDWRPDQCDRSKLTDASYMNQWITQKIHDRKRDSGLSYLVDNGHFTPQYDFIVGPHQVRMLDYVLKMSDESLADDFHKLMRAFNLDQVQLEKLNALGAAARGDSSTHLGVEHLEATTVRMINEMYPSDFAIGDYQERSTTD